MLFLNHNIKRKTVVKSFIKAGLLKFPMVFIFAVAICTVAFAQDSNSVDLSAKKVLTPLEQRMLREVSIDFRDTQIEDVLRAMADLAEVDIIKSPKVIGTVTATLTNVPLEEALRNVLVSHGYAYILDKNIIRIVSADEIAQKEEKLVTRVYRITYANVKEVEKALEKFLSEKGALSSSCGSSNIIVTDTESRIKAIDTFIDEIDRITPQILVEVRIYDITTQDTLDLGIQWQAGRTTEISDAVGSDPETGTRRDPFMRGLFKAATGKTTAANSGLLRVGWWNPAIDVDVILNALQESSDAKLLANPRIMVLDNETALFNIVRELPYVERTINNNTITETVKFKNVGVTLEVTPHVTRNDMLRLHIKPEFGVYIGDVTTVALATMPIVDTRNLDTITLLKNGETVVLGGLRKKDVSKQTNKIPLLGDLPLLGGLFRFEGEDTTTTELVIFITPYIITKPALSETERQQLERTKFAAPEPGLTRAEKSAE